jgi:hypothetical protein
MGMDSIREPNRILYRTYLERLDQRLRRSQARIDRKVQSALRDTVGYWSIFKESLSLAEREMSKQEWMNYREQILRNEREFLKNSNLSWPLFRRFLLLSDFTELDPFSWRRSYCRIEMVADSFPNQLGQRRPVRKIHILDLNKKTLTSFNALQEGMLGALNNYNESVFYLPNPCPATIRIILESPNGTLSYILVAQSSIESRLGIDYPAGLVDMNMLLEKIYPEIL